MHYPVCQLFTLDLEIIHKPLSLLIIFFLPFVAKLILVVSYAH